VVAANAGIITAAGRDAICDVRVLYLTRLQIALEERVLRKKFGAEFAAYCERVPRWL